MSDATRHRLAALLAERRPDIAEANLLIASEADPDVDVPATLVEVDRLARLAADRGGTTGDVAAVLRHAGFLGDRDDYDDPRNSFLDVVLERRRGLPILLSALTIAVAERVGAPIAGVGLPGHFVVADLSGGEPRYLDPFDGWRELTEERCGVIVRSLAGIELVPEHLRPLEVAPMVRRMLLNLRGSYVRRRRLADALWTVELEAIVDPLDPEPGMQRRAFLIGLGRYDDAERSAEAELLSDQPPEAREALREQLRAIAELRVRMN